jgi:hypothetical protein
VPVSLPVTLTPSVGPSVTPTYKTEEWKIYTNTKYNYSIKYPNDWIMTDLGLLEPKVPSYVTFNPGNIASPSVTLAITLSTTTRTLSEVLLTKATNRSTVKVGTRSAILTEEKDSNGNISYHVVIDGGIYRYILVGKKAYQTFFNLIYHTFRTL